MANDTELTSESLTEEIDRIIHEPARLNIMLFLYVVEEADFVYLLRKTGLTRGNLSVHLQKLEQNGYVEIKKTFDKRIPRTLARLTTRGRNAFEAYRETILSLLQQDQPGT
jgi:DNA-binding MarR family transcriptional regulator